MTSFTTYAGGDQATKIMILLYKVMKIHQEMHY